MQVPSPSSRPSRCILFLLIAGLTTSGAFAQNRCEVESGHRFTWSNLFDFFRGSPDESPLYPVQGDHRFDPRSCPDSGGPHHADRDGYAFAPDDSGSCAPGESCPAPRQGPTPSADARTGEVIRLVRLEREIEARLTETARLLDETGDTRGAKAVRIVARNHAARAEELLASLEHQSDDPRFPRADEGAPEPSADAPFRLNRRLNSFHPDDPDLRAEDSGFQPQRFQTRHL